MNFTFTMRLGSPAMIGFQFVSKAFCEILLIFMFFFFSFLKPGSF